MKKEHEDNNPIFIETWSNLPFGEISTIKITYDQNNP